MHWNLMWCQYLIFDTDDQNDLFLAEHVVLANMLEGGGIIPGLSFLDYYSWIIIIIGYVDYYTMNISNYNRKQERMKES